MQENRSRKENRCTYDARLQTDPLNTGAGEVV